MTNPTFMWQVTMAVHEDRVRAVQRSRKGRSCSPSTHVRRPLGLYRRLIGRLQARPARVAPQKQFPNC